jgi:hypothetical protein
MTILHKPERRVKPRIHEPLPVSVSGIDESGRAFETETQVDNISANGLYMRLAEQVESGAKLALVVQFSMKGIEEGPSARVAAQGLVLRSEPQQDGSCGLAVEFTRHRFF